MRAQIPHPEKGWIDLEIPEPPITCLRLPRTADATAHLAGPTSPVWPVWDFRLLKVENGTAIYENTR